MFRRLSNNYLWHGGIWDGRQSSGGSQPSPAWQSPGVKIQTRWKMGYHHRNVNTTPLINREYNSLTAWLTRFSNNELVTKSSQGMFGELYGMVNLEYLGNLNERAFAWALEETFHHFVSHNHASGRLCKQQWERTGRWTMMNIFEELLNYFFPWLTLDSYIVLFLQ